MNKVIIGLSTKGLCIISTNGRTTSEQLFTHYEFVFSPLEIINKIHNPDSKVQRFAICWIGFHIAECHIEPYYTFYILHPMFTSSKYR